MGLSMTGIEIISERNRECTLLRDYQRQQDKQSFSLEFHLYDSELQAFSSYKHETSVVQNSLRPSGSTLCVRC
jgi:hypothetical protein